MVGTVGEYYDQNEPEDHHEPVEGVRPPIVMHCLQEGCNLTSWYGLDHWEISIDRSEGIKSGKYTSMMGKGGACDEHRGKLISRKVVIESHEA